MSITYQEAMVTLQSMFGGVDRSVIKMILEENRGHMERTVECLLQMTGGAAPSPAQQQQQQHAQRPQPAHEQQPRQAGPRQQQAGGRTAGAPEELSEMDRMTMLMNGRLPDDFLRPPSYFRQHNAAGASSQQVDQDALLAQMLQDREFMRDLQRVDPNVLAQQQRQQRSSQRPANSNNNNQRAAAVAAATAAVGAGAATGSSGSSSSGLSFKEKWSRLGDAARRKLANLAAKLQGDKSKPAQAYMSLPGMQDESDGEDNFGGQFVIEDNDDDNAIELTDRRRAPANNNNNNNNDDSD